tara:strand:+ start:42273 stop:42770 length:498 start_codon:yes stop_codon:yes gene_type:complete
MKMINLTETHEDYLKERILLMFDVGEELSLRDFTRRTQFVKNARQRRRMIFELVEAKFLKVRRVYGTGTKPTTMLEILVQPKRPRFFPHTQNPELDPEMSTLTEQLAVTRQIISTRGMGHHPGVIDQAIKELERLYLVEASTQAMESTSKPEAEWEPHPDQKLVE